MIRAIAASPTASGWTGTSWVLPSIGSTPAGAGRLAGVVTAGLRGDVDDDRPGLLRGPAHGIVEGVLDAVDVGDVAAGDRHPRVAADGVTGHDLGIGEDRDAGLWRAGLDVGEGLHEVGVRRLTDRARELVAIGRLARAAVAEGRSCSRRAGQHRAHEGPAVVPADRHRHEVGLRAQRVELRGHACVLRGAVVVGLRRAAGDVLERGDLGGEELGIVKLAAQAQRRRGGVRGTDTGRSREAVAEGDVVDGPRGLCRSGGGERPDGGERGGRQRCGTELHRGSSSSSPGAVARGCTQTLLVGRRRCTRGEPGWDGPAGTMARCLLSR